MAITNLTITDADVAVEVTGTQIASVTWGATVDEAVPVYYNSVTKKYLPTNAGTSQTLARARGICLTGGAADTVGLMVVRGEMDVGAPLVVGQLYCVSNTTGLISLYDDEFMAVSGIWITVLGVAITTSSLDLQIRPFGATT